MGQPGGKDPPGGKEPPRRRIRSESDRKKHAGWRHCPRCSKSVSTNGRNFYHHMHKCDRVFFADLIARFDAARKPAPKPPLTPPQGRSIQQTSLSEMQRVAFIQQLCFLRIYDRVVDDVLKKVETSTRVLNKAVFDAIRQAKRENASRGKAVAQTPPFSPAGPASGVSIRPFPPVPLPETFASPMTLPAGSPVQETPARQPVAGPSSEGIHGVGMRIWEAKEYLEPGAAGSSSGVVGGSSVLGFGGVVSGALSSGMTAVGMPSGVSSGVATSGVVPSSGALPSSSAGPTASAGGSTGVASSSAGPSSSRPASAMSISSVINN